MPRPSVAPKAWPAVFPGLATILPDLVCNSSTIGDPPRQRGPRPGAPLMIVSPPAEIGMRLDEVETPALLLDLDAFERNLERLAQRATAMGVRLRPHAKTHKSPAIARRQMALGAVGVCCQKVSEAEAMVQGGVADVLVSNEIAGARKCARLAALAREARIAVCVDDILHVAALSEAAVQYGGTLDVLVEGNVGRNACGGQPRGPAPALVQRV